MSSTITRKKTNILSKLKELQQMEEQGQVILHCLMPAPYAVTLIRIWPTTYLLDREGQRVASLVHPEGIPLAPTWMPVWGSFARFTLVFSGLDKTVSSFRMQEYCNGEGGAMETHWIERNASDVYQVELD